jgi:hypothetical protein
LTISASITPPSGGLVPGGTPAGVSFSVHNPSSGNQDVRTVTLTGVAAYTDSTQSTVATGCDTTQFSMAPVTENQDVGSGNTTLNTGGSLVFADSGSNQDACKNAFLVASFSSN